MAPLATLAGYRVVAEIGRGSQATVYRAVDPKTGDEVAIKLLALHHASALARFERERRLLEGLGAEEGFVPLVGAGSAAEGPFLVMPFVGGGSLEERLERGSLTIDEAIALGHALASAVARAHARGVVHRDLKPANVLFTKRGTETGDWGRPLVADLGIAKHFDRAAPGASQSASLSKTGVLMGTAGYTAPEQLRDAKAVGPPADVFALGAILYECVAGRPAFPGATPLEVLEAVETGRFEPLRRTRAGVPGRLDALVARALARDPTARFADAADLARALEGARHASRAPLAIGLAAGTIAVAVLALATVRRPPVEPERAPSAPPLAPAPSRLPPPFDRIAATRSLRLAWTAGDPSWCVPACSALAFTPDGKKLVATGDESIWILDAASGIAERILEPGVGWLVAFALSPSGKLALVSSSGRPAPPSGRYQPLPSGPPSLQLWDLERGALVRTLEEAKEGFGSVAFSPSGALAFAVGPGGGIRVFDVATGERRAVLGPEPGDPAQALSAGDDRLLAGGAAKLRLWDVASGRSIELEGSAGGTVAVALLADRRHAATGGADGSVKLVDLATGESTAIGAHAGSVVGLALSRDERTLATSGADGRIKTWDVATGAARGTVERPARFGGPGLGSTTSAGALAFAPAGDVLVSAAWDQRLRRFDASGRPLGGDVPSSHQTLALAVDPRGRFVVTGSRDGGVLVREARTGTLVRSLVARAGEIWCVAFSADGSRLAAAGWSGDVVVWDVARWSELARFNTGAMTFAVGLDAHGQRAVATGWFQGSRVVDLPAGAPREGSSGYSRWLRKALFTPDGARFLAGVDHDALALWDLASGKLLRRFHVGLELQDISMAADGKLVLLSANPGHASLWSVDGPGGEAKPIRLLEGHKAKVIGCALSPSAARAATASEDRTIRLWNVADGRELDRVDLAPICDRPTSVVFDGESSLVVATDRGFVLAFEIDAR